MTTRHIARQFDNTQAEDGCPCPKAACGFVIEEQIAAACPEHPWHAEQTIRRAHSADQCPGAPEVDQRPAQLPLNRDQLAALLAHHAAVLAAQLRTDPARDAWIAAERLDTHANSLTSEEEPSAVAELLDAIWTYSTAQQPAPADPSGPDTLAAWLYSRFINALDAPAWDLLPDADRTYWEHQARAVRRAVARGGFKAAGEQT